MKAQKVTVKLSKVAGVDLPDGQELLGEILVPMPDQMEDPRAWAQLIKEWPKKKGVMEKPVLGDVLMTGLVSIARRELTASLIERYKEEHNIKGDRRGKSKVETVEI